MTTPSTPRRAGPYAGNSVSTTFNFAFKVFAASEVAVVKADIYGAESTLVLNSDYSVTLNEDQGANPGGTITYPILGTPLATGEQLVLTGGLAYGQTTSLPNGGAYNATVVERTFDRIVMLVQQLLEMAGRGIQLAVTASSSVSNKLPSPVAGAFLAWNGAANAIVNAAGMASVAVSSFMATVVTAADAATARATLGAAKSGANTDITSLSSPALGSATATTQTAGDNSTKVATTAYVATAAAAAVAPIVPGFSSMAVISTTGASTWTIPAGVTKAKVTVVGGGNSGNAGSTACGTIAFGGGGGGGGGVGISYLTGLIPGNTLTTNVGAAATSSSLSSGTQTITTITATAGAVGGSQGGGAGGTSSGAQLNVSGNAGGTACYYPNAASGWGGSGGHAAGFAGGGAGGNGTSNAGTSYGAGGGGGSHAVGGGAGYQGVIIIEY